MPPMECHTLPGTRPQPWRRQERERTSPQTRRNKRDNKQRHVPPVAVAALWNPELDVFLCEHFYLHSSGIWGRHESCNKVHETVFGFQLRLWCNFITQRNGFIKLCLLWSLRAVCVITPSLCCNLDRLAPAAVHWSDTHTHTHAAIRDITLER